MPSWGAVAWGSPFRPSSPPSQRAFCCASDARPSSPWPPQAALLGPLLWDLILRHTGGDFFVDAPGVVFPVSFEDTGSGVFAAAIGAVLLGLGPLGAASGRRVAVAAVVCGGAALLVDIYLY